MQKKTRLILFVTLLVAATLGGACNKLEKILTDNTINNENHQTVKDIRFEDDFYEYINQDLLESIELSDTQYHWSWFSEIDAKNYKDIKKIIKDIKNSKDKYPEGSSEQKIRDLYECATNIENRNNTGLQPIEQYITKIKQAKNIDEYVEVLAQLSREYGISSIIGGFYIEQDMMDSNKNVVYLTYADTLIGKEYIEDKDMKEYVSVYFEYVEDMLMELGYDKERAHASRISIENICRQICDATLSIEDYMNPQITNNRLDKNELQKLYYNIDTNKLLRTLEIDASNYYIIEDLSQAKMVNSLLTQGNLEALKEYSVFALINDLSPYATEQLSRLNEEMDDKLEGVESDIDIEYNSDRIVMDYLGWDIGKIYVENNFSEKNKEDVLKIIYDIINEYKVIINKQEWMSQETKNKAVRKLETMTIKIGYPDNWPETMNMTKVIPISEGGSLLSNLLYNFKIGNDYSIENIDTNYDKTQWSMAPYEVNAYYNPGNNEIVFPAGILQAPFYDENNDYSKNLGGIGMVIAHEISHAFDSSGAMYDEYGNVNQWWTDEELIKYDEMSKEIINYYNGYEIAGKKVNGKLTLSENIADLGAITCITSIIDDDSEKLDNLFSQFAYIWASESTVDHMLSSLSTDTHSPDKVRVNATLSSCDAFYKAYDIQITDKMYVAPEDRVGIWK